MSQSALALAPAVVITVVDGIPTTTSVDVARHFGKRHDDVLRAIRSLLDQLDVEHARNFAETFLEVPGPNGATRQSPAYRLTRDGFTLLAMGFTGKKALRFKLAYIDAFNRMEAELSGQARIDPAELLLSGQSDPVLLPPEVEQALHRRTWELTREAYDLIEEHLRRRVACWSYAGYPEKVINIDSALHALDTLGDLGEALAHAYLEKVDQIASYCNAMGRELRNTRETMQTLLAQHGLRASI